MYQDNLLEIQNLQLKIKALDAFIGMLRDPEFDSFDFLYEGFSTNMSKDDVNYYLRTREEEAQGDLAGFLTDNAIARLRTAMDVIEAQSALLLHADSEEEEDVEGPLAADHALISVLFDKARTDLAQAQKHITDSHSLQELFMQPMSELTDRSIDIAEAGVTSPFVQLDRDEAIQQIANGRLEFAELDIERLHYKAAFAETKIHHAIFLRKSHEVGILPTANIEDEIKDRIEEADDILKGCKARIPEILHYMNAVRKMAARPQSPTNFDAQTYIPVPLSLLSP